MQSTPVCSSVIVIAIVETIGTGNSLPTHRLKTAYW